MANVGRLLTMPPRGWDAEEGDLEHRSFFYDISYQGPGKSHASGPVGFELPFAIEVCSTMGL